MGVKGAALATVLSQACSAVWVLTFLFSRHASLPLEKRYMALNREIILLYLLWAYHRLLWQVPKAWLLCSEQQPERFLEIFMSAH